MNCYMENFAVQIFKHFPCLCQGADIYLEVGLDPVVGTVVGVDVHQALMKYVPIN